MLKANTGLHNFKGHRIELKGTVSRDFYPPVFCQSITSGPIINSEKIFEHDFELAKISEVLRNFAVSRTSRSRPPHR